MSKPIKITKRHMPEVWVLHSVQGFLLQEDLDAMTVPNADPYFRLRYRLVKITKRTGGNNRWATANDREIEGVATFKSERWQLPKSQRPAGCVNDDELDRAVPVLAKRLFEGLI